MTNTIKFLFPAVLLMFTAYTASAQNQQEKSPEEMAVELVNKMETELKLEPHQTFYVDSILCDNYVQWVAEIKKMQAAGVSERTVYQQIKDRWDSHIDSALVKILTPEQFLGYQKMMGKYKKPKKGKK